jgi:benzoate-CoA ligase
MSSVGENLVTLICDHAVARGLAEKPAIRQGERMWTYGQLTEQVARVSGALRALRMVRGERVAVFMRDTLEAAASLLGIIHAGGVAVPLSELATPDDLRDYLVHSGSSIAIVDETLEPIIDKIRVETSVLREVLCIGARSAGVLDFNSLVAAATSYAPPVAVDPSDVCLILYSSGSVPGELRSVAHSHRTIWAAYECYAKNFLQLTEDDRVLSVIRLSTAYGLGSGLLFPLAMGAETIMLPEQPRSEVLVAAVEKSRPTILFATPSIYGQLARDCIDGAIMQPLKGLRLATAGAEAMPEQLLQRIRQVLGTEVTVGYGLSEIFQFALAARSADAGDHPGSCGKPLAGVEVRVVDEGGAVVGPDEIGTLQLRCASLFVGYWGDTTSHVEVEPGGWFTTRDRFFVDKNGWFHHCGRVDDLFKVGGKWVSPVEVERALGAHEAVWECAVVGIDDEDGLIKPLAFVVPNVGHSPNAKLEVELRTYVKQVLAPYKYPRWIEFVESLPRGPGGKLLRYKLRPARRRRRAETGHQT